MNESVLTTGTMTTGPTPTAATTSGTTNLGDVRMQLLRRRLVAAGLAADRPAAPPAATAAGLGAAERRMWKIYELDPASISHNIGLVLTFTGGYTAAAVAAAFELMVRRAEVLGSVVAVGADGAPHRVRPAPRSPHPEPAGRWLVPNEVWAWGNGPVGADESTVDDPVALARAAFDLGREPPIRARIGPGADGSVRLTMVLHHLAVDDTSWPLLLGTLASGVWPGPSAPGGAVEPVPGGAAEPVPGGAVEPVPGGTAVGRALRHATDTWAAADVRYPLSGQLPADSATESWLAPLVDRPGIRLLRPVATDDVDALGRVAQEIGATRNALLIAVCAVGVHALTGSTDHVLLVPVDNRRPGETPDRVGYCGNIVPIRFVVDPAATIRDTLRDAVSAIYRAMEFATVDYGAVLTALRQAGGRFPVAEVMASVRNAPLRGIPAPPGRRVNCETVFNGVGNYPLTFAFEIAPDDGVHLEFDYQPEVVTELLAESAVEVISELVQRIPDSLELVVAELATVPRGRTPLVTTTVIAPE